MRKIYLIFISFLFLVSLANISRYLFFDFFSLRKSVNLNSKKSTEKLTNRTSFMDVNLKHLLDLNEIIYKLKIGDEKWIPRKLYMPDGSTRYEYLLKEGELDLTSLEIKKRIKYPDQIFNIERNLIIEIYQKLNLLGVSVLISNTTKGSLGFWNPSRKIIVIDPKIFNNGSINFLNILSHKAIHVAQSCFAGGLSEYPIRIGLPLDFSIKMDQILSHSLYRDNTKESLYLEQEAYTYAKKYGFALDLLNKYC